MLVGWLAALLVNVKLVQQSFYLFVLFKRGNTESGGIKKVIAVLTGFDHYG